MKNLFTRKYFLILVVSIVSLVSFSSCEVEPWNPYPGNGWGGGGSNQFYDSRLNGYWRLDRVNSSLIGNGDTNYLYFNGMGRGVYYYLLNGRPYSEVTTYWCQRSGNGVSGYQINLRYSGNGEMTTMYYWFEGNYLWMQWRNQSGVQTYVYSAYPYAPW